MEKVRDEIFEELRVIFAALADYHTNREKYTEVEPAQVLDKLSARAASLMQEIDAQCKSAP